MQYKRGLKARIENLLYDENVQCDEGIKRLTDDIMDIINSELKTYEYKDCDRYTHPVHIVDHSNRMLQYK